MDRRSLAVIAIFLVILMFIVAAAGLDNLPRRDRDLVAASAGHLAQTRPAVDSDRAAVEHALAEEPALFEAQAPAWRDRLNQDRAKLEAAAVKLALLQQLAKANRRTDRYTVEREAAEFDSLRAEAQRDAAELHSGAARLLSYKRELPGREAKAKAAYQALKAFDVEAATAPVRKAMTDWPLKRDDLQTRLDVLKQEQAEGLKIGEALPADPAPRDYAAYFQQAERLDAITPELQRDAAGLNARSAQLYTAWDKVLVDVDRDGGYRERLRTVRTRDGQTTTDERWERVDSGTYQVAKREVGMALEHKAAGKYDSEVERAPEPPGYAYVAPPGQTNSYGSWSGGVWHWLPEYLILSQMLHASRAPAPITTHDFDRYQSYRRLPSQARAPWGPGPSLGLPSGQPQARSSGQPSSGWYKERPRPSWGDKAYNGSKYQNRGAYSGSRYQSRGTFGARSVPRGGGGFRGGFRGGRR